MQDRQQIFKSSEPHDKIREVLVLTILEKTLASAQIYHNVLLDLEKKYNSSLNGCYEHPEYLREILKDQHNNLYKHILKSITQHLEIFSDAKSIARFLQVINS